MQTRLTFILFILLVGLSYILGQWLAGQNKVEIDVIKLVTGLCNPAETECYATFDGHRLAISFSDEPSALTPFTINMINGFSGVNRITVDFVMQGMEMGINQLDLIQSSDQQWTAKGLLSVCSLGRNDWLARVHVYQADSVLQADFHFQSKIE